MFRALLLALPGYALLQLGSAARDYGLDLPTFGAGALAAAAAAAIWLEAGEYWVLGGTLATFGWIWAVPRAYYPAGHDVVLSVLATLAAFLTAGWLVGHRNVQARGRLLASALGLELQSATFIPLRGGDVRECWLRGSHAGRRVGGRAMFDSDGAPRSVRLWTSVPRGAPFRAFACHDSWGEVPLDPALSLVKPAPWEGVRLYATDAEAAARWARSVRLDAGELQALQHDSKLHVRGDAVEWDNRKPMAEARLKDQLEFLTRAAARLEGA